MMMVMMTVTVFQMDFLNLVIVDLEHKYQDCQLTLYADDDDDDGDDLSGGVPELGDSGPGAQVPGLPVEAAGHGEL